MGMSQLVPITADRAPCLIDAEGERASYRFFEFFTANIRNPHTRRTYPNERNPQTEPVKCGG